MEKLSAHWVRYALAAYLRGKGISWGCGGDRITPLQALDGGKYSLTLDYQKVPNTDIVDTDYGIIAGASLDHLFIGPRLSTLTDPLELLRSLLPKLKQDSHILFHTPDTITLDQIRGWLAALGGFQEKDTYTQDGQTVGIWKLVAPLQRVVRPQKPPALRRACVARYGAIGDAIIMTPLLRALKEDGYEVTVNCTPYAAEVFRGNPHVDNIVLQERDVIPNSELGDYWKFWSERYDKYTNLSESIEGSVLRVEGRRDYFTSRAWRESTGGRTNYYSNTLSIGGYPPGDQPIRGELYFNSAERKAARYVRERFAGRQLILWGLKGSSHHKQYPLLRPFLEQWLPKHPSVQVIFTGAENERGLGFEGPQVLNAAGQMPLREVFALTEVADLVVGPESSLINAAGCFATPKLVLRSHSTCDNLCKHFLNHTCLAPETGCHPCLQLHYTLRSCPLTQIQDTLTNETVWEGPSCCVGVTPERLGAAIETALNSKTP